MRKIYSLFVFIVLFSSNIFAQGYSMLNNSNYSPLNSVTFNPAKIADSREKFQINLFSFNAYVANDYGHFKSLKDIIDNAGSSNDLNHLLQIDNNGKNKNFDLIAELKIPLSFVASINDKSSIAFTMRARTLFGANDISQKLLSVLIDGLDKVDNTAFGTINDAKVNVNANVYAEGALSYGRVLLNSGNHVLKVGITGKYIFGGGSAKAFNNHSTISVLEPTVGDPHTSNYVETSNLDANIGYSNPNLLTPGDISFKSFLDNSGTGFGGDIGFEYEWRPNFEKYNYEMDGKTNVDQSAVKYKLKFGAAITDLGSINYKNGKNLGIKYPQTKTWSQADIDQFDTNNLEQSLINVYGNSAVISTKEYKSYLPTSLNLNLDYNITNHLYIAANVLHSVINTEKAISPTGNMASIAPRFESRIFELAVPVTYISRYDKVNFGLGIRSGFFFIGSDDLGGVLGFNKFSSVNVYTGINFSIGKKRLKDKDGDKISDNFDKCPKVFGPIENFGCPWPDKDGDGTPDKDDACPTVAGPIATKGCPDTDGDGIPDKDDACPTVAGPIATKGCPDTDGDGIPDKDDACPTIAGPIATKGCPDTDGDGTPDKDDACPTVAGPIATKGCPDTDGDGILDKDDACPTIPGPAATKGCPDRDNDGIADNEDACPDEAGPAVNNGCPLKKAVEVVVVNTPLTKVEQKIISKAVANLQFETGKAVIKKISFPSLKAVATLLLAHPEFKLTLSGHTDNVGTPAKNLILSQKRAEAVKDYLDLLSVDASRITTAGYGQTKPLASNKTAAGKKKNRRVEFKIE